MPRARWWVWVLALLAFGLVNLLLYWLLTLVVH